MQRLIGEENSTVYLIVISLIVIVVGVVIVYALSTTAMTAAGCGRTLRRLDDGTLRLEPGGQVFPDMNAFQQWWHAPGGDASRKCPLPLLTGAREVEVLQQEGGDEQMWAKTPIYKVDDYEFSRVFGIERNGHMDIPRQDFNIILDKRTFDWPDKPLSSDERRSKYMGLQEGFTAGGDLKSIVMGEPSASDLVKEATSRYGERRDHHKEDDDIDCHISREAKEVAAMVAKAYENDPNFEPVVTKVGANHWEVNELKPKRREGPITDTVVEERVVNTDNDEVDIKFKYRENIIVEDAIDPYFPWAIDERRLKDPYYGPVPNMERMFGPTFDHKEWYFPGSGPLMD